MPIRSAKIGLTLVNFIVLFCAFSIGTDSSALVETYDARISGNEILTPAAPESPRINGPALYGCTPNKPLVYRMPTQGVRPMTFSAKGLPHSIKLDRKNGILSGKTPDKKGDYKIILIARNNYGEDSFEWTLVVGDKIALTPPMGWNHWYTHYHFITDRDIRAAADAMVASGMADVGYSYVSIDDCWMRITEEWAKKSMERKRRTASVGLDVERVVGQVRDKNGRILPNANFPDMVSLTEHIHQKGLKAGIYTSPGPRTCQEFEGSWQHEAIDAATYAEWGFDLLKYDWCRYGEIFNQLPEAKRSLDEYKKPYQVMWSILQEQNRDILQNLCQYGMAEVWKWGHEVGHSWRTGGDLGHTLTEGGVYKIAKKNIELRQHNGPCSWNDPDYLILGKWRSPFDKAAPISPVELTPNEQYSYVSLWCLMACPLFFSGDMSQMDDFTVNLLCNPEMIAVNQDRLGLCAEPVRMDESTWILKKEMSDGSVVVGFFDVAGEGDRQIRVTWDELDICFGQSTRDLWRQKELGVSEEDFTVAVGPLGCAVIRFTRFYAGGLS